MLVAIWVVIGLQIAGHDGYERGQRDGPTDYSAEDIAAAARPCGEIYDTEEEVAACQREKADLRAQRGMQSAAWFAVVISFGALIGLGFTVRYAYRTWRAARKSARADNKALKVARKQIKEARRDARKAQRISRSQSRAYVRISDAEIDFTDKVGELAKTIAPDLYKFDHTPRLLLTIENAGITPTVRVRYWIGTGKERLLGKGYIHLPGGDLEETSNLPPNSSQKRLFGIDGDLAEELFEYIQNPYVGPRTGLMGRVPDWFTIRGYILYEDVFGYEIRSDFGFCCARPREGAVTLMGPISGSFPVYRLLGKVKRVPIQPPPVIATVPHVGGGVEGEDE